MADNIDRQKAIETAMTMYERCTTGDTIDLRDMICESLAVLPTIEAEPVRHGKWEVIYCDNIPTIGECSECKAIRRISNYCPNCGAKMDEEDKNAIS